MMEQRPAPISVDEQRRTRAIKLADRFAYALGTGLYVGIIPPRLGTLGAIWGVPLAWGIYELVGWAWYLPIVAVICLAGVWICGRSEHVIGKTDPSEVVFDEIATMPIVFFLVPSFSWPVLLIGFVLHRIWDVSKPLGINRLQELPGGWGIMLDDVASSILAAVCMQIIVRTGMLTWITGG